MDLKVIEKRILNLPAGNHVYIEVASPPFGDYTGYHVTLNRDEAVSLAIEVARSDAPDDVALEADDSGDLLMTIREVS